MNPCARCNKTVYPVEKLTCLDKTWHKNCFSCEVCKMALTMKSYKGYNKLPYCNAHYPSTKFTTVADTPENLRLQKNTKQTSNIEYHKQHRQVFQGSGEVDARAADDVIPSFTPQGPVGYQDDAPPPPPIATMPTGAPRRGGYRAMYEYEAQDADEADFIEGDVIVDVKIIDEHWCEGCVRRTNKRGMIPFNYIEEM